MQSRKEYYIVLVIVFQMKLWQNKQLKKVEGYPNTSRKKKKTNKQKTNKTKQNKTDLAETSKNPIKQEQGRCYFQFWDPFLSFI